jgi:PmbA protein
VIGEARALETLETALGVGGADEVQSLLWAQRGGLTRFAESVIHQHTERANAGVEVRVFDAKRSGTVATNRLDAVRAAGAQALEIARLSPPDELFPGLPGDGGASLVPGERFDEATAAATPGWRAKRVAEAARAAGDRPAAGFFSTDEVEVALANTRGVRRYARFSVASFTCLIRSEDGTAHHESSAWRAGDLDLSRIAGELAEWADRGRGAGALDAGSYPVVLMPLAVGELVTYLGYMGFGAKDLINGESFYVNRTGERVASDLLTIADDVGHPASLGTPFDMEGVWRQRVGLIEKGVAVQPVYDSRTAAEAGTTTTGHASGSNEFGPYTANLVVEPGDRSPEQLVEGMERGLLVHRFWYVNVVDQREAVLTGMTRDGLFAIEDGRVTRPVRNLRFTQNVLTALEGCTGVGRDLHSIYSDWGSAVVPSLRLESFNFTSATTH